MASRRYFWETASAVDHRDEADGAQVFAYQVAVALHVTFEALVAAGIWLANAMVDARNADNCLSSGRRNCIPLDVPPRQQ